MRTKKLLLAVSLSFISAGAFAENYQFEVGAQYLDFESVDGFALAGQYHFQEVDTSGKPLAESAFLGQSNNLQLAYTDIEDSDATAIAAEFYINNFYVAPSYVNPSEGDGEFAVALGYAVDNWRVTTVVPEEDYELNVNFKYVTELGGSTFLNFEAGYADGGDFADDTISVAADYYFDSTFSVGAILLNAEDTDVGIRLSKFFTGTFQAGFSYISSDFGDLTTLDASIRF